MSDKTIIITRPKGDEKSLTDVLHALGLRVIHEPLTDIYLRHTERTKLGQALLTEPDALILTSRHAVHALAMLTELRDEFLICIGDATAQTAQSLGFTRVSAAGGTAQSLLDYIYESYDEGSRFLYLSGEHVRVEIDMILNERGMVAERLALYEAIAAPQLSDTLVEQLRRNQIDGITFLSQRAAQIFIALLAKAGAQAATAHLHAFCISETAAQPLAQQPWRGIHIADEPTLASLVNCVDNALQTQG